MKLNTLWWAVRLIPLCAFACVPIAFAQTANISSYWKLDETNGNAVDATINGNNLSNIGTGSYIPAKINNGYNSGSGNTKNTLHIASNLGYTGGAFSVNFWFKQETPQGPGTNLDFFDLCDSSTAECLLAYEHSGTSFVINRFKNPSTSQTVSYAHTFSTSTFEMWTVVYDGTTLYLYLNGALVGSNAAGGNGTGTIGSYFYIGSNGTNSFLSGIWDEFGTWTRALSSTEITALYNGGAGLQYPFIEKTGTGQDIFVGQSFCSDYITMAAGSGTNTICRRWDNYLTTDDVNAVLDTSYITTQWMIWRGVLAVIILYVLARVIQYALFLIWPRRRRRHDE